jgi:transcriptional regulator NrdR family protein
MNCPKCKWATNRAAVTTGSLPDQVVRKRVCCACQHIWFTVEVEVPNYAVGWSPAHKHKPVLRSAITLKPSFIEAQDGLAIAHAKLEEQYNAKLEKEFKPIRK